MNKSTLITTFLILLSACNSNVQDNFDFSCADELNMAEIKRYQPNQYEDYSDEDLDLLAEITTFILDINGDSAVYEVFFNSRTPNSLTIDVFGLEDAKQIDKTVCSLFESNEIKMPEKTILLFHRYENEFDDGGVVFGLTRK